MKSYLTSILTLIFSVAFGIAILWSVSDSPALSVNSFFILPLQNRYFLTQILAGSVPLIFTGLAAASAFCASVFNIGLEGQLYFGTLVGTSVALLFENTMGVLPSLAIAFLVGAGVAFLSGILKVKFKIDELISTFLLSNGMIHLTNYLLNTYMRDPTAALSASKYLRFSLPTVPFLGVHFGFIFAVALAILLDVVFKRTVLGYEIRVTGQNFVFAKYSGIDVEKTWLKAFVLSGGLASLAGIVDVIAVHGRMVRGFSFGYGWNGIAVALLARNRPAFVVLSALFFSYLDTGAQVSSIFAGITPEISKLVQASVFYFVTAEALLGSRRSVKSV